MPETLVEVLAVRRAKNPGKVLAHVALRIRGDVTVRGAKILQAYDAPEPRLVMPSVPRTAPDGTQHFRPLVELSDALKRRVDALVFAEWNGKEHEA